MKRIGLFYLVLLLSFQLYSQKHKSVDRLMMMHDSVYNNYRRHADTLTLNSWFNIMQSNRYLSLLHYYDSLIKVEYSTARPPDSSPMIFNRELVQFQKEIKYLKSNLASEKAQASFYKKMYWILIALSLIFLTIIIALSVLAARTGNRLRLKEESYKKQYTDFHAAQLQIEKARKTENQMASEINRLKKQQSQLDTVSMEEFQSLLDEKLLIENQIVEIKKAFEMENQKRMEAESLKHAPEMESESMDDKRVMDELRNRLSFIQEENDNLNEQLSALLNDNQELNDKINDLEQLHAKNEQLLGERTALERDLQNIINKLKNQ